MFFFSSSPVSAAQPLELRFVDLMRDLGSFPGKFSRRRYSLEEHMYYVPRETGEKKSTQGFLQKEVLTGRAHKLKERSAKAKQYYS